jgi:hypothetical protein
MKIIFALLIASMILVSGCVAPSEPAPGPTTGEPESVQSVGTGMSAVDSLGQDLDLSGTDSIASDLDDLTW